MASTMVSIEKNLTYSEINSFDNQIVVAPKLKKKTTQETLDQATRTCQNPEANLNQRLKEPWGILESFFPKASLH